MSQRDFKDEAEEYNFILDNLINGNITDFRESIRGLSQITLIDLIQFNLECGSIDTEKLLIDIKRALKK